MFKLKCDVLNILMKSNTSSLSVDHHGYQQTVQKTLQKPAQIYFHQTKRVHNINHINTDSKYHDQ